MLDDLLNTPAQQALRLSPAIAGGLERAARALAQLDQALSRHPLQQAYLYRVRLDAVRRQAAVDGQSIDPWHLAAMLEGLRLRMESELRIIDRGIIFEAARHALGLHQWLTTPGFDQEGEVQIAERALEAASDSASPLLAAAFAMHEWLEGGGRRAPFRAALIRHWTKHRLLRIPVPLTAPKALGADVGFARERWVPLFLHALADEAADYLQLLFEMERIWLAARAAVAGRRSTSRAAAAIDILAAAPLASARTLAAGLGMAVNNATALLDSFASAGLVVEVTHRSKRRLFGLAGLAPLREGVVPPRRPMPGRGRGRPPVFRLQEKVDVEEAAPPVVTGAVELVARQAIDYGDVELWMAQADQVIRSTRQTLDRLARAENSTTVGPVL